MFEALVVGNSYLFSSSVSKDTRQCVNKKKIAKMCRSNCNFDLILQNQYESY